MTIGKRVFDILISLALLFCLLPILILVSLLIYLIDGGPVFYLSERMSKPTESFQLIKFRTMSVVASESGVSGGDKSQRITKTGRRIRQMRIDEIPQLVNVLKGEMSLVGPRPPLRQYVERFPEIYDDVLLSRPGITGLATLHYHRHEERLLANTRDLSETDAVYSRTCVPRKARLDIIYQAHSSLCFDMIIILKTVMQKLMAR